MTDITQTIGRAADGQLTVLAEGRRVPVRLARCFPWSAPGRYLSLRDAKDLEVGLIEDLELLLPKPRAAIEEALAEAGFVLEIEAIEAHDEEIELRTWVVRTRQGRRRFQTKLDSWPRRVPGGGLLIRDVAGDLYYVRDPEKLDSKSQQILWAFID